MLSCFFFQPVEVSIGTRVGKIVCLSINCPVHPQFSRDSAVVASKTRKTIDPAKLNKTSRMSCGAPESKIDSPLKSTAIHTKTLRRHKRKNFICIELCLQEKQSIFVQISFVLMVIVYMLFGALMFMILEGDLLFDDSERHEAATRLAVSKYTDEQRECLMTVSRVRPSVKRSPAHRSSRTGQPTLNTASSRRCGVCIWTRRRERTRIRGPILRMRSCSHLRWSRRSDMVMWRRPRGRADSCAVCMAWLAYRWLWWPSQMWAKDWWRCSRRFPIDWHDGRIRACCTCRFLIF